MTGTTIQKGAKCCAFVGSGFLGHACGRTAKVEQSGRFYCGVHDPVRAQEKRAASNAKWKAELDAKQAAHVSAAAKQAALERDAARYRWEREHPAWDTEAALSGISPEQYDAAIDAAMEG